MVRLATRRQALSLFVSVLSASLAPLAAAAGERVPDVVIEVALTPPGELYPALDLSQAPRGDPMLGGGTGLLRVTVRNRGEAAALRLRVDSDGLRVPAGLDLALAPGEQRTWWPRLDWDAAALQGLTAPRRQDLRVSAEAGGIAVAAQRLDVRLHGLDEALYYVRSDGQSVDLAGIFAAYVDPHSPAVDTILARAGLDAAPQHPLPAAAERARRLALAEAVWAELVRRGLRYSADVLALESGPRLYSQRVQLPDETWRLGSAHCLDASVLIASVLERLGVPTFLVLVPGHALVGFYVDAARREAEIVETTLLAGRDAPAGSFAAARAAGRARYRRALPHLAAGARPGHMVIDVSAARAYGIMPLAVGAGSRNERPPGD
ncbi:MAG TPA: hypothetical protein VMR06_04000 [Dokdonella sp.]|uniref:hypothetical protein n=1 Tax=Dokdonella sp. TaxID=2291710 RepID=UPI002C09E83F|nr:hypothetical protein [Dokdonella sp.]HUD41140.1 hypothetical protein [Dokdonella sp.]